MWSVFIYLIFGLNLCYLIRVYRRTFVESVIKEELLITILSPIILVWYSVFYILDKMNTPPINYFSFKTKKLICKMALKSSLYYNLCWLLPFARTNFYRYVRREMFFDFDKHCTCGFRWKFDCLIQNILYCNPLSWYANLCGQKLISLMDDSKLLTDHTCRLYENPNQYFTYSVTCGFLKITKKEYFDTEKNEPANLFLHGFLCEKELREEKEVIFSRFVFTKKQVFEVFKDLEMKFPELWKKNFYKKYTYLLDDLTTAKNYLKDGTELKDVTWNKMDKKMSFALKFCLVISEYILPKELQYARNNLLYELKRHYKKPACKEVISAIDIFYNKLVEYDVKLKMNWKN